jgi:hypothetical protein
MSGVSDWDHPAGIPVLEIINTEKAITPVDHNNWLVVVEECVQISVPTILRACHIFSNKALVFWLRLIWLYTLPKRLLLVRSDRHEYLPKLAFSSRHTTAPTTRSTLCFPTIAPMFRL